MGDKGNQPGGRKHFKGTGDLTVVMTTDRPKTVPRWKFPEWQPQFQDAILEFDPRKLPSLVEAAATAISMRLLSPEASPEELRALANALRAVRAIQTKRLQIPGRDEQE
jgi:hypothetical protein